jgi:hypothetical protein
VFAAFVIAGAARLDERAQCRGGYLAVIGRRPGQHAYGSRGDVGTVEDGSCASGQVRRSRIGSARVGTGRAGLSAVEAILNTDDERILVNARQRAGIGIQHRRQVGHPYHSSQS